MSLRAWLAERRDVLAAFVLPASGACAAGISGFGERPTAFQVSALVIGCALAGFSAISLKKILTV